MKKFLMLFFWQASLLWAQTDYDENLREACRSRIAGEYLRLADLEELGTKTVKALSEQKKAMESKLKEKENERDLKIRETHSSKKGAVTFTDLEFIDHERNALKNALDQTIDVLNKEQAILAKAHGKRDQLAAGMKPLFVIKKSEGKANHLYTIEYKRQCQQYKLACPLTDEEARFLRKVFSEPKELPEVCQKYADFLRDADSH